MKYLRWLLLVTVLLESGCRPKPDPQRIATEFFTQIGSGKLEEAYRGSAFGFQAQQSPAEFARIARTLRFTEFSGAEWGEAQRQGKSLQMRGEVRDRSGEKRLLLVELREERGAWKVYSIARVPEVASGPEANLFSAIGKEGIESPLVQRPIPSDEQMGKLIRQVLLDFNKAVATDSFKEFHAGISAAWAEQVTAGQIRLAFQSFVDEHLDLSAIRDKPVYYEQAPYIDADGVLLAQGYFSTTPSRVFFLLKFKYEAGQWKLFGLDVKVSAV